MNGMNYDIKKPSTDLLDQIKHKIDTKTKPLGALGRLEEVAQQVALIQQSLSPTLRNPHIVVFAADHGIAKDGVSAYPQEVTFQMVMNFLAGGAAINVFSRQHDIALKVVDAGVNFDFDEHPDLINAKVAHGTRSFLHEKAMNRKDCELAMDRGAEIVRGIYKSGSNVIGFGEMGIGNTSSASMLMHTFTGIALEQCIGKGTGVDEAGYQQKLSILSQALKNHEISDDPIEVLATYGGFELAMMCGAFLQAATLGMVILVDGFIASAAFLTAMQLQPNVKEYAVFCHQSEEKGHRKMLESMEAEPLLDINMRLGEGTGCAVAYPILQSAVNFFNQMASFESAGVSEK